MKEVLIIDSNQESALKLARFLENPDASIVSDVDAFVDCCSRCEIRSMGRCTPVVVSKVDEGLKKIKPEDRKVVLINAASLKMSGLDALKKIKEERSGVIVIMIGADSDTALEAMLLGALDVALRTSDMEGIHRMLGEAFCRLYAPTEEASKNRSRLVGESEPMFKVKKEIGRVASSTTLVLLEGETGTGKEVVAQLIHQKSGRLQSKFKAIDCGAINQELLESELFGHEPGAYTGAPQKKGRLGAFRSAKGGTLFLDEIGNTTAEFQKRLLRVLETQEVLPMGGDETDKVDVRVIAATNQDLKQMVKEGTFRKDLFFRLKVHEIYLPPLRKRKADIKLLVSHFLRNAPRQGDQPMPGISEPAMKLLEDYNWPGNVRELENCIKSAARSSQGETILPKDLPQEIRMYREDEGSEGDVQERQSSETPKRPMYENLFDVSVAVFCQFISEAENITETDIINGSKELAPHAHRRVTDAERAIHKWEQARKDGRIAPDDLRTNIGDVVTEAVIRLSELRYRSDSRRAAAKPFSIVGKTLEGSLIAVLNKVVEEYGNDRKKAAEMLKMHPKTLDGWLNPERTGKRKTSTDPCTLEHFPDKEVESLLMKSVDNFVIEQFSRAEWREKSPNEQIRIVHLALRTVSGRLAGDHGCIYFGGMTFKQIKKQIYRRAAYLYSDEVKAAEALGVDVRTFRKHWSRLGSEAAFPDHYTLF